MANKKDPSHYTHVVTDPPKPPLVTPFDDLLLDSRGRTIGSSKQWQAKRKKILHAFASTLGLPPQTKPSSLGGPRSVVAEIAAPADATERVPPLPKHALRQRVIATKKLERFERRKIEIPVHRDEVVTAYLCVPNSPLPSRPAVLCLPETDVIAHEKVAGMHGMGPYAYGARLAEAGFVTLCPNHFVAGERTPKEGAFVTASFYRKYPKWSAVGKAIWDHQACLDYLQSLDMVNPKRIGCMGHSLGAHSALFLAATDERVRCVVSNCGITSFRCNPNRCQWSRDGWYIYFPSLRAFFLRGEPAPWDFHEMGAAVAPRAWLDISSLNDPTFPGSEHLPGMFTRIQEVYNLLDASARFAFYTHGEPHGMWEHSYALAASWLQRWLCA